MCTRIGLKLKGKGDEGATGREDRSMSSRILVEMTGALVPEGGAVSGFGKRCHCGACGAEARGVGGGGRNNFLSGARHSLEK